MPRFSELEEEQKNKQRALLSDIMGNPRDLDQNDLDMVLELESTHNGNDRMDFAAMAEEQFGNSPTQMHSEPREQEQDRSLGLKSTLPAPTPSFSSETSGFNTSNPRQNQLQRDIEAFNALENSHPVKGVEPVKQQTYPSYSHYYFPRLAKALEPEKGYSYGDLAPVKKDKDGTIVGLGTPNWVRGPLQSGLELVSMAGAAKDGHIDVLNDPYVKLNTMQGLMDIGVPGGMSARLGNNTVENVARTTSRNIDINAQKTYNAPELPQRPFEQDYPNAPKNHNRGPLTTDIDGRPLTAPIIVGRTHQGGADRGISPEVYDQIGTGVVGKRARRVPQETLGPGVGGATDYNPATKKPTGIEISEDIARKKLLDNVHGHEIGHAIDQMAGEIPTEGLEKELREMYHTTTSGYLVSPRQYGPENYGYDLENTPRELMAEAIRSYMENPNYIKTVAPNVAAQIRAHVNANPNINKVIQFNAQGPGSALLGAGMRATQSLQKNDAHPNENQKQEDDFS